MTVHIIEPGEVRLSGESRLVADSQSGIFVRVTFFRDQHAKTRREEVVTLAALRSQILATTAPAKAKLPWLKLARFGDKRSKKDSLRHDDNVVDITGIEADYDREEMSFAAAVAKAKQIGIKCIVYTSPSHAEERPRWRILCPTSKPLPPGNREALARRLDRLFGNIFDAASFTLSQAFYFGSVKSNPAHRCEIVVGDCIDEIKVPREDEESAQRGADKQSERRAADEKQKQRVDIDQRLRDMQYQGEGDASIHNTQLSVSAAMLERGFSIDEIVTRILEATKVAAGRVGEGWDWQEEADRIRQMCEDWLEDDLVVIVNRDNCLVLEGGKTLVLRFERTTEISKGRAYSRLMATFLKPYDFKVLYCNQRVVIGERSIELGDWWLKHPRRRQYAGVVFMPGGGETVDGKKGDWGWMRKHIFEVLAAGDDAADAYIMNWLAWAVQNPAERAEVVLAFRGKKGTGKGTLGTALMRIFGQHAHHISSATHLAGRFNAHMRDCCYLFADEAYWPGDKAAEGALKRLITEPTLFVEAKYRDGVTITNRLHVMMASNEDWVVPAGEKERRFAVFDVSDIHCQDARWFSQLYDELEHGGYEAMFYDLLNHDLRGWHPRKNVPCNAALAKQQAESLSPLDAWWVGLLESGELISASKEEPHRAISNRYEALSGPGLTKVFDGLYDQARRSSPRLRHATDDALGRYLKKQGCSNAKKVRRRRGWTFPPLAECREKWEERFPGWEWQDPDLKDWTTDDWSDD
jgi:Family of unknown function (DUF5906)